VPYRMRSVDGALISLSPYVDKPLNSVMHDQCDARPTVTFPAAGHRRPLTGIILYCLVTEARVCEQLAQGCYLKAERTGSNRRPFSRNSDALNATPPGDTTEYRGIFSSVPPNTRRGRALVYSANPKKKQRRSIKSVVRV